MVSTELLTHIPALDPNIAALFIQRSKKLQALRWPSVKWYWENLPIPSLGRAWCLARSPASHNTPDFVLYYSEIQLGRKKMSWEDYDLNSKVWFSSPDISFQLYISNYLYIMGLIMTFPLCTQCILTILIPSIILICPLTTSTDPLPLLRSSSFHVLGGMWPNGFHRGWVQERRWRDFYRSRAPYDWLHHWRK